MTRLQRAIIELEQATAGRDAHRARELWRVNREWEAVMARLTQEYSDASREARNS